MKAFPPLATNIEAQELTSTEIRSWSPQRLGEALNENSVSSPELQAILAVFRPTIATNPVNQVGAIGGTATFVVIGNTLANTDLALSYQWQFSDDGQSWTNISGATAASYTTPDIEVGWNNRLYRCVVSNQLGSRPSEPATLNLNVAISNAYDPNETATFHSGSGASELGTAPTNYIPIQGAAAVRWGANLQRLPVNGPGDYTITSVGVRIAKGGDGFLQEMLVIVCELDGGSFTRVATSGSLMAFEPGPVSQQNVILNLNLPFTVEAGKTYYYAVALQGSASRTTNFPGWVDRNSVAVDDSFWWQGTNGDATLPSVLTGAATRPSGTQFSMYCEFETNTRLVYQLTSPTAAKRLIPARTDDWGHLKINNQIVSGTDTQTISAKSFLDAATWSIIRNSDAGTLTFGGQSQSIASQAGNSFDLDMQYQMNGANAIADLLYVNLTAGQGGQGANDIATISHAAKHNNSRTATYALGSNNAVLEIAGTGTIASIQIGWQPVIIFGDSMANFSGRYGTHLPGSFTQPRIAWQAQISGNALTQTSTSNHTAGYLRYKNTTIGLGDLCQFRDVVFAVAGYGLNDISRIGTNPAQVSVITDDYFIRLEEVIDDLIVNNNQVLVIGLAPYHAAANASEQEAQAIISWINIASDLCVEKQVAWITPWWDLVEQSTADNPIPLIRAIYDADGGTHINSNGAELISGLAAESFESGVVGGTWPLNAHRFRYPA